MQQPTDSYHKAASSWSQSAKRKEDARGGRRAQSIPAIINNLCTSKVNTAYPPRDKMNKFLRAAPTFPFDDIEDAGNLLIDKLESKLWQVHAKAMGVMESVMNTAGCEGFHRYWFYCDKCYAVLEHHEQNSPRAPVRARATAVLALLRQEPVDPPPQQEPPPSSTEAEATQAHRMDKMRRSWR